MSANVQHIFPVFRHDDGLYGSTSRCNSQ